MRSYREQHEATTANYGPTQVSGVHEAPTSPAPYLDELPSTSLVGSIPLESLSARFVPIVSLRTGRTFAFEALPHCSSEGLSQTEELFARAAFEKKVGELGRAVRRVAFAECPSKPIFVGVHAHELKESWLIRPDDPISAHDAEVFLEVNQPVYTSTSLHVLTEVAARSGISIVLDDFGGSASNPALLAQLSPACVKLDCELVEGVDRHPRKAKVVAGLVRMCTELGAQVIAKGISTEQELRALADCGVSLGQGELLGTSTQTPTVSGWRRRTR
jgi:EAL domain-containing protein (putative c-di-GMP-specific phosphodiesterase class I)